MDWVLVAERVLFVDKDEPQACVLSCRPRASVRQEAVSTPLVGGVFEEPAWTGGRLRHEGMPTLLCVCALAGLEQVERGFRHESVVRHSSRRGSRGICCDGPSVISVNRFKELLASLLVWK